MDIKFESYEENPEFSRKEISFCLFFEGAIPSKESIKKDISLCYGVEPDLIALEKLRVVKGKKVANGKARVYSDASAIKKYEK
ncbi:MAG: hypothetical protein PHI15_07075 [Methanomicrobium sp.]|nr:hypothetical protein [Methanomicrobium sp.]